MDGIVRVVPRTPTPKRTLTTPKQTPKQTSTQSHTTPTRSPLQPDYTNERVEKTPERAGISFLNEAVGEIDKIFEKVSPQRKQSPQQSPQRTQPRKDKQITQSLSTPMRTIGREYKPEEINNMMLDYFHVPRAMWGNLPLGSHVRFFKVGSSTGSTAASTDRASKNMRFRPGGFVKAHADGLLFLETKLRGKEENGNICFPVTINQIDEIWKKPDRAAYIEIAVMTSELNKKEESIQELRRRVDKLETVMRAIAAKVVC
tara:strand:+ start:12273 stop:13049 length:777 start_codon:yes stop_codon:yes gene_type:complete